LVWAAETTMWSKTDRPAAEECLGERLILRGSKPHFQLPVRVLARLFRCLMLTKLVAAHTADGYDASAVHAHLTDAKAFAGGESPSS
jgi:hypothetical protein